MKMIHSLDELGVQLECVLTVGTFDGVHRGHQHLVQQIVAQARGAGLTSVALTFDPHPRAVLRPAAPALYLSTPEERAERMLAMGLDWFVVLPFTHELAALSAEQFLTLLARRLSIRELWVGSGFALGRHRAGTTAALEQIQAAFGYRLHVIQPLYENGAPISSTRIRQLITQGQVRKASRLLGHEYTLTAQIVPGDQRGRRLGYRTANVRPAPDRALPPHGVYAMWASVEGQRWPAVANVGVCPSFGLSEVLIEVHLLDFEGDLYGQTLQVAFVERLRAEKRFDDVRALIAQIGRDVERARALLGVPKPQPHG
ncbi:MAG: bifunctional riboflavin kinase/FAD synthetase [Chloroflexota bacterium]